MVPCMRVRFPRRVPRGAHGVNLSVTDTAPSRMVRIHSPRACKVFRLKGSVRCVDNRQERSGRHTGTPLRRPLSCVQRRESLRGAQPMNHPPYMSLEYLRNRLSACEAILRAEEQRSLTVNPNRNACVEYNAAVQAFATLSAMYNEAVK